MTSDGAASSAEPRKHQRFTEPAKFLPVIFVSSNILGLYLIYCCFHLYPMMQFDISADMRNAKMRQRAIIECIFFQIVTALLVLCYVCSILYSPGEIPNKDDDPHWEYHAQEAAAGRGGDGGPMNLQESKRSGERRYCKWCAKYKPDRCHHCRVCRTCILKMDHHCPWIYNCVGFRNHKYFFLLLFYSVCACHIIVWTMIESVRSSVDVETPFLTMFLLLFGETLAAFLGILVTAFFGFHIWLMMKAMTTIEFCEKSLKKTGYDSSVYDHGPYGNITSVLGPNPLLWFLPVSLPKGDGLNFVGENARLLTNKQMEPGRGQRRRTHVKTQRTSKRPGSRSGGSDPESGGSDQGGAGATGPPAV